MSSARLRSRVGEIGIVGVVRLDAYRHVFSNLGRDGTAKGNIEPWGGEVVHGALYRLTDTQLGTLDRLEGGYYVAHYERGVAEHGIPRDYWLRLVQTITR